MDLLTEPVTKSPRRSVTATSVEWLDLLAARECDQATFLQSVAESLQETPDGGWELLALLDQYYRRNKISAEVFTAVKARLQDLLMGSGRPGQVSRPVSQMSSPVAPEAAGRSGAFPSARATTLEVSIPTLGDSISIPASMSAISLPVRRAAPPVSRRADSVPISLPLSAAVPDRADTAAPRSAPTRTLAVGDVLRSRYTVQAVLGQGGMGTVFEAVDQYRLDRANGEQKVALKVLHTAVIQRPRLFAELRREFQHLQSLSHPNIVRVHEFDRDGDLAFFTMEYLNGVLLMRLLTAHVADPLDRACAWSIVRDVGAAVVHAHSRGVVHGDLNPCNIFITDDGEVRVLDFGAAHPLRRTPWISDFENSQQINVATPSYASCQLLEGETADPRDDVYAMACVTYILLTGRHPFRDLSALKARTQHLKPERPSGITRGQWHALRDGLQFERERRPSDMQAWLKRLQSNSAAAHLPALPALLATHPIRETSLRWLVAVGGVLLVAGGIAWGVINRDAVSEMQATASAKLKTRLADTVLSQLWSSDHEASIIPPPEVAEPPNTSPQATPSAVALPSSPPVVVAATPPPGPAVITPAPALSAPAPKSTRATASLSPETSAVTASTPTPVQAAAGVMRAAAAPAAAQPVAAAPGGLKARLELSADTVDVPADEPVVYVTVRRNRTLRGEASFSWWTESGTAKPGRDFSAVKSQVETMPEGKNSVNLAIPIIADPLRKEPRSFYVVIDEPSDNALLGQRTLTMVTLP